MEKILENLYVGDINDAKIDAGFSIVHATKTVFDKSNGDFYYEKENDFFLNWVDSKDEKYFDCYGNGVNIINKCIDFISNKIEKLKVLIHCDLGHSRSPSIAMLYLAKRKDMFSNSSIFIYCFNEFRDMYPFYKCGEGLFNFMNKNWHKIK